MKKSLKFLIPSMFGLLVAGCSLNGSTPIKKGENTELINKSRLDAVAVDSYTTSVILDSLKEVSTSTDVENPETPETPETPDETPSEDEAVDEKLVIVNNYIKLFDTLTNGDGLTVEKVASDKEEYKFKVIISSSLVGESGKSYTIYFNEVTQEIDDSEEPSEGTDGTETESPDENEVDEGEVDVTPELLKKHHHDEFKDAKFTRLTGIIVTETGEIAVEGHSLVTDTKTKTVFKGELENGQSLKITSEISDSKKEYSYQLKEGHRVINEYEVEIKTKEDSVELEIKVKNGKEKERYVIEKSVEDTDTIFEIHYKNSDGKGKIIAVISKDEDGNDVITYEFKDGKKWHHDDHGWHHGWDDDYGHCWHDDWHHEHHFDDEYDWDDDYEWDEDDFDEDEWNDDTEDLLNALLEALKDTDFDIDAFLENYYANKNDNKQEDNQEEPSESEDYEDEWDEDDGFSQDYEEDYWDWGYEHGHDNHKPYGHR